MMSKSLNVDAHRNEILSAIAEVRTVARSQHDEPRTHSADWLDELFIDATDEQTLRKAAASALTLYGGNGSFADVGDAESAHAVDRLRAALRPVGSTATGIGWRGPWRRSPKSFGRTDPRQ